MNNLMEPKVILPPQPTGMKHRFHAMVKPVGSLCNLDCTYCYYLHKEGLLHQPRARRGPRTAYPPVHRGADRRRGGVLLAGWRAHPAWPGLLRQSHGTGSPLQEASSAHRERSSDQRPIARRRVGDRTCRKFCAACRRKGRRACRKRKAHKNISLANIENGN